MSPSSIIVENLGKRYFLGQRAPYRTLRDGLSRLPARLFGRESGAHAAGLRDQIWALRGVSLEISEGEAVGIIGHNGAGKSTFLKLLSRITEPTEGRAILWGRSGSLLEVGTGFHPELTGRENVYLNGAILGMRRAEIQRRFDTIVDFAEIGRFLDTPVKYYSSGMYVRLAFAVAAHLELDILLVDEVLAVGDVVFQSKCLGKMDEVASEGRTVIMVSHNMTAISQLCDRALLFEGGALTDDGVPTSVIPRYLEGAADHSGWRKWQDVRSAPGDALARLLAVRVVADGAISPSVAIDSDVSIEVDFRLLQDGLRTLAVDVYLLDSVGNTVLSTANTDRASVNPDGWFGQKHPAGTYTARCTIPANLLNDLRYFVTVHLLSTDTQTIHASSHQAVSFDVFDTGEMRDARGTWHGVVRPRLRWDTSLIDQAGPVSPGPRQAMVLE